MFNFRTGVFLLLFISVCFVNAHNFIDEDAERDCVSGCIGSTGSQVRVVETTKYYEGYRPLSCLKLCHKHRVVDSESYTYSGSCCVLAFKSSDGRLTVVIAKKECQREIS
jgi:hypothetical protein